MPTSAVVRVLVARLWSARPCLALAPALSFLRVEEKYFCHPSSRIACAHHKREPSSQKRVRALHSSARSVLVLPRSNVSSSKPEETDAASFFKLIFDTREFPRA